MDRWCPEHYDACKQRDSTVSLQVVRNRMEDEKGTQAVDLIRQAAGLPFEDCLAGSAKA